MLILMFVCLLADPTKCREERLSFSYEEVNAMACMIRSREKLAEWQQSHPDYRINRWKCVPRGAKVQDI